MKAFWGKGKFQYNVELCFSAVVDGDSTLLRLIAKDTYNLYVNGVFVCYGPARSAENCARVDEIDLKPYLNGKQAELKIFVQGNNTKAMCFAEGEPYFGCEVLKGEEVVKTTENFDCFFMQDKLVKVEKMSYQRTFCEIYDMQVDRGAFSNAYLPVEKVQVATPTLLERNVKFSKNEYVNATLFKSGVASLNGEVTWDNDFTNFQLDNGINLFGYKRSECDYIFSYDLDKIVYGNDGGLKYGYYEFDSINVGKFRIKVKASEKCKITLVYDDLLIDGEIKFNREQIIHALKWTLEKGEYLLESNEVYQAKYISLVTDGKVEIEQLGMVLIENPTVDEEKFRLQDEDLNKIVCGAIRTFKHNAYDLPTDCASRERAGYLCDGFFSARAEKFFTGENRVERNLLENYLYYKNNVYLSDGVLPMCYPSAPKGKDDYIPNWMLWYIVQLEDCLSRTGDRDFILKHRSQVYKTLEFFQGYENEYGLLENLDGWVFVEWSKANDFINGVNFPSNMLYAGAIECAGKIFEDERLLKKATALKKTIYELAFDGELFVDNALRENGKLIPTQNVSETCQNYAIFFKIVDKLTHPEFFAKIPNRFGAFDESGRKVWRSNMFIGYVLRLEILYGEGLYDLLLKESKQAFLPMVETTGTIWEHFETHSSCNHGFGAIVGMLVYKSALKIQKGENDCG